MNQGNSRNIILAIKSLQQLWQWTPQRVYWTYIWTRAHQLRQLSDDVEQLAFARLLCLNRISESDEVASLQDAWGALARDDRAVLTHVFVADGINENAYAFIF